MTIETQSDLEGLQRIGRIVSLVLHEMLERLEPGMTTAELDAFGAQRLADHGARSAPKITYGFPGATCISINEEAAHGIPGARRIAAGDVVNVDVSAELDGFFADTGGTRVVPPADDVSLRLCDATKEALESAMRQARAGNRINQIGKAIERVAKRERFNIIRNLGSHGVGRALHEEPGHIPGFYDVTDRRVLRQGMVITIEPFLSTRTTMVEQASDGWTLFGPPGTRSAQYEHTMVITRGEPIVVTRH
ncbi:methionyl aminopeptidase [Povalibacter uvarum]|uniref:Methionine aminopeptidase n=1 Tax=Povalibacter uvarum TaxID=732238 RepID=A0A841HQR4_9GAMM|nr:type I methionyl aminopeptidase [Povalibacter uvarum]MBB6095093.1 methionyl aminopeptidase [Povalibacter uvarum]